MMLMPLLSLYRGRMYRTIMTVRIRSFDVISITADHRCSSCTESDGLPINAEESKAEAIQVQEGVQRRPRSHLVELFSIQRHRGVSLVNSILSRYSDADA
jgi:hypothetical protein